jgi:hypothetical protein
VKVLKFYLLDSSFHNSKCCVESSLVYGSPPKASHFLYISLLFLTSTTERPLTSQPKASHPYPLVSLPF